MHYVIGDVHGHYTCLMQLLQKLNLQPDDKVMLVGDILDRAPSGEEQAKLIAWALENIRSGSQFSMVLGNHEYDFMNNIKQIKKLGLLQDSELTNEKFRHVLDEYDLDNPYALYTCTKDEDIDWISFYKLVQTLPCAIELTVNKKLFYVTHSWLVDEEGIDLVTNPIDWVSIDVKNSVWDRKHCHTTPDFCTVVHGHTPTIITRYYWGQNPDWKPVIVQLPGNVNIDTCCYAGPASGNLTAYCLETETPIYLWSEEDRMSALMNADLSL